METVEQLAERLWYYVTQDEYATEIAKWLRDNGWVQVEKPKSEPTSTPAPSAYSREQVAEALAELLVGQELQHPSWHGLLGRVGRHFHRLYNLGEQYGCGDLTWQEGYNLIAAAHGLPKLGEGEACPACGGDATVTVVPTEQQCREAMQRGESQPVDEIIAELRAEPTPPPAPEVADGDRDAAKEIRDYYRRQNAAGGQVWTDVVEAIIVRRLAPERAAAKELRAENERLRNDLGFANDRIDGKETAMKELQARLDAAETKLRRIDKAAENLWHAFNQPNPATGGERK